METQNAIHGLLLQFQFPVEDFATLSNVLTTPLDILGLLPPRYRHLLSNGGAVIPESVIRKHLPQFQRALLTNILPTWTVVLQENDALLLVQQYFCPDVIYNARPIAGEIALCAYSTLVSLNTVPEYAMGLFERLVREYPLDRLFLAVFGSSSEGNDRVSKKSLQWEDCVRDICMVPVKVANAVAGGKLPSSLENAVYFNELSIRTEELISSLALKSRNSPEIYAAMSYLFTKLVNIGLFPSHVPTARSHPSFFISTLPHVRNRLFSQTSNKSYNNLWSSILLNVPTLTLQSILICLFSSLSIDLPSLVLDDTSSTRALIKREAMVLEGLIGRNTPEGREELWEVASAMMVNTMREWTEAHARLFVCWVSGDDSEALSALLDVILETLASSEFIKHSLLSRHKYTTALFLLTLSYLPPSSPSSLISNPSFIRSISTYISHTDPSVRRCGMLVAEEAARLAGKKLEFGDWEGQDDSGILSWAREVRKLIKARDVDATLEEIGVVVDETAAPALSEDAPEPPSCTKTSTRIPPVPKSSAGYDSDDSLTGYASPPSSRSPSPSPSELQEIEKDPTLNVGVKKVPKPVYLAQLGELLRGQPGMQAQKADEPHEADRIEMALNVAEELIRRKRAYGSELDENAANMVYGFLGLQDKYGLDGFSEKRQGVLNALVACAPKKAAPALIEEFFKNQYSADQRFVALNALALGARELASLPVPPSLVPPERTAFPSKMLPEPLHKKYIASTGNTDNNNSNKNNTSVLSLLLDEISGNALSKERSTTATTVHPVLIRERRLRVQKPTRITEVAPHGSSQQSLQLSSPSSSGPSPTFITLSAEHFLVPLINRFWSFLHDSQTLEERTSLKVSLAGEGRERRRYRSAAGTGMLLNPVVLAQFFRTLGILVHASRNAPEWMAIIAPGALEIAVTVGTKPVSYLELEEDEESETSASGGVDTAGIEGRKEASVLTAALEVALVVLDGALELDGGKVLGLEHTTTVLAVGEWAGKVFAALEKGLKVPGGGGMHEAKLSRASAGVLLKVDELTSRWRRSMLDTR